jgi:hypothetical protein
MNCHPPYVGSVRSFLIYICAFLLIIGTAIGVITREFSSWSKVFETSTDVVLIRCLKTPSPTDKDWPVISHGGIKYTAVETIYVLRGSTNLGVATLRSLYWPKQGENYLVFATQRENTNYEAMATYRIVPLGVGFPPIPLIDGKPFAEQIQFLFKYRATLLNTERKALEEEKSRLDQLIKN